MNMSRSIVLEGVSLTYLFHTCRAISCGDERADKVFEVILTGGGAVTVVVDAGAVVFGGGVFVVDATGFACEGVFTDFLAIVRGQE